MPQDKELIVGTEMYACQDCRIYDPATYQGPETIVWTLRNGTYYEINGMRLPLSSSFIPCQKHREICQRLWGSGHGKYPENFSEKS